VRVAIVGCGRAARQHIEALALSGSGRVAAVVDENLQRATDLADATGAVVASLEAVLDDHRIDAVSVCTPPGSHCEIAIAALIAGKAVLVEKPVARTAEELDAMLAAADARSLPALAMLQHRGSVPLAALSDEWTGDAVASIEVLRERGPGHYSSDAWRGHPDHSAGGHVAHLAVHYVDLACQLLGEPAEVLGLTECRDAVGIETRAALSVRFADGALLSVLASAHAAPRSERLRVSERGRELTLTGTSVEYQTAQRVESKRVAPTPRQRAWVYEELAAAVRGESTTGRYALARARGVTMLLEQVRCLVAAEAVAS
jgi:predicted dehydrogenase